TALSYPPRSPSPAALFGGGTADIRLAPGRDWSDLEHYIQIPPMLADSAEFVQVANDAAGDAQTPYRIARNIEEYLQANYAYTLDLPLVDPTNPLLTFLTETRRGHCEYFATAMAMLARQKGLATRIVNGFSGGDWNAVGEFWAVRQSHAHSWVEVFLPDVGWTTFDPTPPDDRPESVQSEDLWSTIGEWVDSARMLWFEYVVDFSLEQQLAAVSSGLNRATGEESLSSSLYRVAMGFFRYADEVLLLILLWTSCAVAFRVRRVRERDWSWVDWAIGALLLLGTNAVVVLDWPRGPSVRVMVAVNTLNATIIGLSWLARRRPRETSSTASRRTGAASRWFLRLARQLMKVGYAYHLSDTPADLIAQAREREATYADELQAVIQRYQMARFSREGEGASSELRAQIRALMRSIKRAERRA
ncbi:MAG: transglutaminase domain-containing protein, partial [Myxococcales bacterium]|nr:transglutaminase domain-containing protein [Myxococcales bacterium]